MYLNYEDLQVIVNGPQGQADALLKSLDQELVSLKRQVVVISFIRSSEQLNWSKSLVERSVYQSWDVCLILHQEVVTIFLTQSYWYDVQNFLDKK